MLQCLLQFFSFFLREELNLELLTLWGNTDFVNLLYLRSQGLKKFLLLKSACRHFMLQELLFASVVFQHAMYQCKKKPCVCACMHSARSFLKSQCCCSALLSPPNITGMSPSHEVAQEKKQAFSLLLGICISDFFLLSASQGAHVEYLFCLLINSHCANSSHL